VAKPQNMHLRPAQKEFVRRLVVTEREHPARLFELWCEMAYCAVAKPLAIFRQEQEHADELEARYMRGVKRIGTEGANAFAELLGLMIQELEATDCRDFLGEIAGEVGALHAGAGQYFTPWEVGSVMARMTLHDMKPLLAERRYITIAEPCSGAGVLVLAARQAIIEQGVDHTHRVWWWANDVLPLAYHMTYLQMAFAGCSGLVTCSDALRMDGIRDQALLPCSIAFIARNGYPVFERTEPVAPEPELAAPPPPPKRLQVRLPPVGKKSKANLSLFGDEEVA
jgi:hypothetical protein